MINGNGQLSELELTKMENFALRNAGLQQAIRENIQARDKYIQQIEAAHPGYRWNENSGLMPVPPQEAPPQAAAEA